MRSRDDRRRVWSADEINAQLDEIAEVIREGVPHLISGIFFGSPQPRQRRKPRPREQRQDGRKR